MPINNLIYIDDYTSLPSSCFVENEQFSLQELVLRKQSLFWFDLVSLALIKRKQKVFLVTHFAENVGCFDNTTVKVDSDISSS